MATHYHKAATTTLLALAAMLAGCAHSSYRNDTGNGAPGEAVRATLAAQVANPAAARNPNPAAGIDGNSARAVIQRYELVPEAPNGAGLTIQGMTK